MSDENKGLLSQLILVSKEDSALASIAAERRKLEKEISEIAAAFKKIDTERLQKLRSHDEKKSRYNKEEKRLRDEHDKLVGRRKALTTLNNYKLQQSAEKEIEHAAKALNEQEETLLESLEEIDKLNAEVTSLAKSADEKKAEHTKVTSEAAAAFKSFSEREATHQQERLRLVQGIDAKSLTIYDRVKERFVMDPVVEVVGSSCKGCHMQVGPQIIVQISRGTSLVRCPGCGRILFLKEGQGSQAL